MVLLDKSGDTHLLKRSGNTREVKELVNEKGYFSDWGVHELGIFRISENDGWNLMFKPIKDISLHEKAMIAWILKMEFKAVK